MNDASGGHRRCSGVTLLRQSTNESGKVLVFFPMANGNLMPYIPIVRAISTDVDALGLEYCRHTERLEEVAKTYARRLASSTKHGDQLFFFGLCYAGVVAYETVNQLADMGIS